VADMSDETTEWAARLVDELASGELIDLDEDVPRDTLLRGIGKLLAKTGDKAKMNADVANQLAEDLSEVDGVAELFVTAEDLQKVLAKTDT
jgi:predicted metalloendopeptidase